MVAHNLSLMAAALLLDAIFGDPAWLYRRIPHPVSWMGAVLNGLERRLNRGSPAIRIALGAVVLIVLLSVTGVIAWALDHWLSISWIGWLGLAVIASTMQAQRSLYDHVEAVFVPLNAGNIADARTALSRIVGRDTTALDESAVCRAAIESLAENLSDGVVAPLFWGCVLGLPGIVVYKAINTADSMIGHRTERFLYFGRAAARLDDAVNYIPARITGFLIALSTLSRQAWWVMIADAGKHRSPNAGWPEAAMAGALEIRLSGPRIYSGVKTLEPWINPTGSDASPAHLRLALSILVRICASLIVLTAIGSALAYWPRLFV
jgi:adenosylcobinamide-phosphate synthase